MDDDEATKAGVGSSSSTPERGTSDDDNEMRAEKKAGNSKKRSLGQQVSKYLASGDAARHKKASDCVGCRAFLKETCEGD